MPGVQAQGAGVSLNATPPALPWKVLEGRDRGAGEHYRFHVVGLNLHYTPPRPFSWTVPSLEGFDLSETSWAPTTPPTRP